MPASLPLTYPPDLLLLIVSRVTEARHRGALRLTCRALRTTVEAHTTKLTWRGSRYGRLPLSLAALMPPGMPARCPPTKLLDCSGVGWFLVSLAGCPPTIQELVCEGTQISDLGPLSACKGLQSLNCSCTLVAELGPLAACSALRSLFLNDTQVFDLRPLAACTGLHALCLSREPGGQLRPPGSVLGAAGLVLLHPPAED